VIGSMTRWGSGSVRHRPELGACLDYVRAGDTLVVWRLDRLGRSLRHLIETIGDLEQREVGFRSVDGGSGHDDGGGAADSAYLRGAGGV
jgi:DNA invertase Pin-like site-specific DNA recombinase